ncbi:hypothetical protein C7M84_021070 [Penaeus vannamei]|uniref:Uncharacterized protein n=1 Tax=Penaeus vannamei TaxID=6689 RepID=A0A3R7LPU2_PENVA|nr:hypothetical protein C7M84_021070 [Penaeus vannamei]
MHGHIHHTTLPPPFLAGMMSLASKTLGERTREECRANEYHSLPCSGRSSYPPLPTSCNDPLCNANHSPGFAVQKRQQEGGGVTMQDGRVKLSKATVELSVRGLEVAQDRDNWHEMQKRNESVTPFSTFLGLDAVLKRNLRNGEEPKSPFEKMSLSGLEEYDRSPKHTSSLKGPSEFNFSSSKSHPHMVRGAPSMHLTDLAELGGETKEPLKIQKISGFFEHFMESTKNTHKQRSCTSLCEGSGEKIRDSTNKKNVPPISRSESLRSSRGSSTPFITRECIKGSCTHSTKPRQSNRIPFKLGHGGENKQEIIDGSDSYIMSRIVGGYMKDDTKSCMLDKSHPYITSLTIASTSSTMSAKLDQIHYTPGLEVVKVSVPQQITLEGHPTEPRLRSDSMEARWSSDNSLEDRPPDRRGATTNYDSLYSEISSESSVYGTPQPRTVLYLEKTEVSCQMMKLLLTLMLLLVPGGMLPHVDGSLKGAGQVMMFQGQSGHSPSGEWFQAAEVSRTVGALADSLTAYRANLV